MQFLNVGQLPSLSSSLDTANYALKGCDVAVSASPDRGQVSQVKNIYGANCSRPGKNAEKKVRRPAILF